MKYDRKVCSVVSSKWINFRNYIFHDLAVKIYPQAKARAQRRHNESLESEVAKASKKHALCQSVSSNAQIVERNPTGELSDQRKTEKREFSIK